MKNSWLLIALLEIKIDEVDVGRHVEFAAAELAHADHHHLLRRPVFVAWFAVPCGQFGVVEIERGGNADLGQRAPGGHDFGQIGRSRQIARGGNEPYPLAQLPEPLVQRGFVGARRFGEKSLHRRAAEGLVERGRQGFGELRLRRQQATAEAGTAGDALKCGMTHGMD
jgi:hypothetical protein